MKILILGGTQFVGLLTAQEAVRRGHEVTILNRGSQPAPAGVRAVVGDRTAPNAYAGLEGMHFDVVIDTWQNEPSAIKNLIEALKGRMSHFIYVSTLAIYDFGACTLPYDEGSPLRDLTAPTHEYVRDKMGGEMEAMKSGVPTLLARAGILLGPEEGLPGRLGWWLSRMERGGPTLAPGPADLGMQFIDVRDLVNFVVDGAEKKLSGPYNLTSERNHMTYGSFLETMNQTAGNKAELCWLQPEQFKRSGVKYWTELPISIAPGKEVICQADTKKAVEEGLKIRPGEETIRDTWAWLKNPETVFQDTDPLGLDPEKEARVLKEYFGK